MSLRKIHYASGILLCSFILLHLLNHLIALVSAEQHIAFMDSLRLVYRNIFVESLLLMAAFIQIVSGWKLVIAKRKNASSFFERLQCWSGIYLAFFLSIHLSAVLVGRMVLQLDTNYYFGVAGLNYFPANLFFIPYYALAILAFFAHIAAIHQQKMKRKLLGLSPERQAWLILVAGGACMLLVLYALTDGLGGVEVPDAYKTLILE